MIDIRPATINDAEKLFAWRNDPVTCANSRSTATVPRDVHDRWMKYNVVQGYPEHIILIADSDAGSIGVVRFDAVKDDLMSYEASITLASSCRGRGTARSILAEACSYMPEYSIYAEIKPQNWASRRIFEECGFCEIGSDHHLIRYRREPLA